MIVLEDLGSLFKIIVCGTIEAVYYWPLIINFAYVWSWVMFFIFLLRIVCRMILRYYEMGLLVEWLLLRFNSIIVEIFILIDWVSVLFVGVVLAISSIVIIYRVIYIEGDRAFDCFVYLVVIFVASMLIIIMSPRLVRILFGWDMLGLVSYCLVIYYQRFKAFNSGIVTVLTNRIGDIGLLLSIGLALINGSWNMFIFKDDNQVLIVMLVLLAAVTKSAQMPFSTWLPMAMAAPTPVSSLVHSSTLVTAGVYLVIRFNRIIMMRGVRFTLLFLSLLTIIISGVIANYEIDLKKIIALSTLSQLGLMILILRAGMKFLGYYHLLTHAIFKSLLFLCVGVIIHVMGRNQDIRYLGGIKDIIPFVTIRVSISILSLIGFPFLSGFYSKDMVVEVLYIFNIGWGYISLILVSLSLTVMYSLRLCFYLWFSVRANIKNVFYIGHEREVINFSINILMFLRIRGGSVLSWLFFYDLHIVYLRSVIKLMILIFFFSGVLSWVVRVMDRIYDKWFSTCKRGSVIFNISMWLLNFLHTRGRGVILYSGNYVYKADRTWVEPLGSRFWIKLKLICMIVFYSEFKVYYIIYGLLMGLFMWILLFI